MDVQRYKHLLGSKRFKLSDNVDTYLNLNLEGKTNLLNEPDIIDIINQEELAQEERNRSLTFRINGRVNIITNNALTNFKYNPNGTISVVGAVNEDWDILMDGNPAVAPNNWIIQVLYTNRLNYSFNIKSRAKGASSTDPSTPIMSSLAYRGIQFKSLSSETISGTDEKVLIECVQDHNLEVGDYVYLSSNIFVFSSQVLPKEYVGIHKVESLGRGGKNLDKIFILDTIHTIPFTGVGNIKRVVNPSVRDIEFIDPQIINNYTTVDMSGNTPQTLGLIPLTNTVGIPYPLNSEEFVMFETSPLPHNLKENNYIEIRAVGTNTLNGLYFVEKIINDFRFIVRLSIGINWGQLGSVTNLIEFRAMDGTPSDYYVRYLSVLTADDYETHNCAYSGSIYPESATNEIGVSNDTWMFQFNKDIKLDNLLNHRNGYVKDLYVGFIKRSGENTFPWSDVVSDWDFNSKSTTVIPGEHIDNISLYQSSNIGTVEKKNVGDEYVFDFVEFNKILIEEKVAATTIHRFTRNDGLGPYPCPCPPGQSQGYYLEPFNKLTIRKDSLNIEYAESDDNIVGLPPNYVTYPGGQIAWRDLLTPGFFEEGTNGVDYPFVNGAHYLYRNYMLYIRTQWPIEALIDNNFDFKIGDISC